MPNFVIVLDEVELILTQTWTSYAKEGDWLEVGTAQLIENVNWNLDSTYLHCVGFQ
jgi:hypothetical protein